jgi:type II secretory pathway pseudopilin PulG
MKLYPHNLFADAKEERRQGERAFTMIEIAIAIGVIGFALVAVIGILPAGMNSQKDNREDTTISQDAPIFLDAIRSGGNLTNNNFTPIIQGLDYLTNYVERISFIGITNGVSTTIGAYSNFTSGGAIVGLLSTPEGLNVSQSNYFITRAIVRSLSGAATEQNGANQATAFRYQMDVEIVPFANNVAPNSTNYLYYENVLNFPTNSPQFISRYNRWLEASIASPTNGSIYLPPVAGSLAFSCFDVRLRFSWPVIETPTSYVVGPGRQTYRTSIAGALVTSPFFKMSDGRFVWYFQPQQYATNSGAL